MTEKQIIKSIKKDLKDGISTSIMVKENKNGGYTLYYQTSNTRNQQYINETIKRYKGTVLEHSESIGKYRGLATFVLGLEGEIK